MKPKGRRQSWNTRKGEEINFRVVQRLDPRTYSLQSAATGISIVGSAPKDLLFMGKGDSWNTAYIAKAPHYGSARECVNEQIISAIGTTLPLRLAESKVVLLGRTVSGARDIRFLSRYFLVRMEEQLVHGAELVAAFLQTDPAEVERTFGKGGRRSRACTASSPFWTSCRTPASKGSTWPCGMGSEGCWPSTLLSGPTTGMP